MKKKTCTILFLVAGLILLAGTLAPLVAAREGVWRTNWRNPLAAPRLGTEVQISTPSTPTDADRWSPAVAYNYVQREYLVVWHNTWPGGQRDIYAQRVSTTGNQVGSWFTISTGSNDRTQPAVAYNATNGEYLVVWMYNANGDGFTYEIWGRIVAWNGSYMGAEFQVSTFPGRTFWTPRVAWNSYRNEYLVVWNAFDTALVPTDIANARLSASGSKLSSVIITTSNQPHQADITYNVAADEYLVVWRRMWTVADGDIRGARLRGDNGTVVTSPGEFTINAALEDQRSPAVTTNQQHRYLVVWEYAYPGPCCDWDIRGQELDISGNLVGSELIIAQSTDDEVSPDAVARPGPFRDYLAVWQRTTSAGEAIYAYRWGEPGVTPYYFQVASVAFWNNKVPAVATDSPGYLIVYEGDSTGDPTVYQHIYGRMWWPEAVYLPLILRNYK